MPTNFSESRALYFFSQSQHFRRAPNHIRRTSKISQCLRRRSEYIPQVFWRVVSTMSWQWFILHIRDFRIYIYNQSCALFFSHFLINSLLQLNFFLKKNVSVKMVMAWLLEVSWFKSNERVDWCTFREAWVRDCAYLSIRSQSSPPHRVVNLTSSIPPKLSQSDL